MNRSNQQSAVSSQQEQSRAPRCRQQSVGWLLIAGCWLLLLPGCIRRSLTVRTDPPDALVYVNDELKGHSPVTYDFMWYGWHRVTIRKEGFQRLDDRKLLRCPIYFWIPFDLFMELVPFPVRDARTWTYALSPTETLHIPVPPVTSNTGPTPQSLPAASPAPAAEAPAPAVKAASPPAPNAAHGTPPPVSAPAPDGAAPPPAKESHDGSR